MHQPSILEGLFQGRLKTKVVAITSQHSSAIGTTDQWRGRLAALTIRQDLRPTPEARKGLMASFRFHRVVSVFSPTYFLPSIHLDQPLYHLPISMDYILKANIIFQVSSDLSKFTIPPNPATSHLEVQTNNERSEGWNEG